MSAPADQDASQLYYSCRIIKGRGGGGVWGGGRGRDAGERVRWVGEREILVVVTQCLLLPTGTHHSYTTHTVPFNITLTISPLPLPWHSWGSGELA